MGAYASTFTKDLAAKITAAGRDGHRLVRNREVINNLALKDPTTLGARGTPDVLTKYKNPSFISRVTNRSAAVTEVFFGNPDERQKKILQAAADYLVTSGVQLLVMDKQMGLHPAHAHHCRTIVTGQFARLLGVQGGARRLHDRGTPSAKGKGSVEHHPPIGNLLRVPGRAILVGEQDQLAVPKSRRSAGPVQQHSRQQAV